VIGIGLWLYYPREEAGPGTTLTEAPSAGGFEWPPLDYLQGQGEAPGLDLSDETAGTSGEEPDEFEVTYGVVEGQTTERPPTGQSPTIETTPQVQPETSAGSGIVTRPATTTQAPRTQAQETEAEPDVAVPSPAAVARATSPAPSTTAPGAATISPQSSGVTLSDRAYWVQAISSPSRDTIEQARLMLRDHQLGSRIVTRDINGTTYYRLRVGPFAVRAEAEKFLGWVQAIDDFSDAMIFVDYSTPVLAANPS